MPDKYGVGDDPYCYSGASVLKNRLNIQIAEQLEEAERELSFLAIQEMEFFPPPYDLTYLCKIHHELFGSLYSWAGELRSVDISKGDTHFCNVRFIEKETAKIFTKLQGQNYLTDLAYSEFIFELADLYCELNMVHPFREGNGRAQRVFIEHLVINAGYRISFEGIEKDEWVEANIAGVICDYRPMAEILSRCIT